MAFEPDFFAVLAACAVGLLVSVAIEQLMTPRPPLARPWVAWGVHAGLWLLVYPLLALLLVRPWFAMTGVSALLLVLVLVNNAKFKALREPFVFQDYEYFTDAVRHPRLYIPFLGWGKFLLAVAAFVLAIIVGLWWEDAPDNPWHWNGHGGGAVLVMLAGVLCVAACARKLPAVSFQPVSDTSRLGFLACLWRYAMAERQALAPASSLDSFADQGARTASSSDGSGPAGDTSNAVYRASAAPHLVAIQSESFFDARSLFHGVRHNVLAQFDRLKADSVVHGKLTVPAWGANTVRTEFAFLTGIAAQGLGVHRFNPYRAVAAGQHVPSVAALLKSMGYRTVCIHPYLSSFYRRNKVYPDLGFDEFLDISAFDDSGRAGPYMGDQAVADKVASVLAQATGPTFIFAITMENHGPLHLEKVEPGDVDALYARAPPLGCDDLTIYLRHLRNADRMVASLRHTLEQCGRAASLCWYGDHVPIMPSVYNAFGAPAGQVDYVCWHNRCGERSGAAMPPVKYADLNACELARRWLEEASLLGPSLRCKPILPVRS